MYQRIITTPVLLIDSTGVIPTYYTYLSWYSSLLQHHNSTNLN